jgi:hypothetical protein
MKLPPLPLLLSLIFLLNNCSGNTPEPVSRPTTSSTIASSGQLSLTSLANSSSTSSSSISSLSSSSSSVSSVNRPLLFSLPPSLTGHIGTFLSEADLLHGLALTSRGVGTYVPLERVAQVASHRRATKLADRMIREAGDSVTASQYQAAAGSYYDLACALGPGAAKEAACIKAIELVKLSFKEREGKVSVEQYEWAIKIYNDLLSLLPRREAEEVAGINGVVDLVERMLERIGEDVTIKQYELAAKSYNNLATYLPLEVRETVCRRAIRIVDSMLTKGGGKNAQQYEAHQYEVAAIAYNNLGHSLYAIPTR